MRRSHQPSSSSSPRPHSMRASTSRTTVRRPLTFSRLRTAHDSTLRSLVSTSWDTPPFDDVSSPSSTKLYNASSLDSHPSLNINAPGPTMSRSLHSSYPTQPSHQSQQQLLHYPSSHLNMPYHRPSLPPRASTDVSGAAMHAARVAEMAARDAADASAAAKAAASYAQDLLNTDRNAGRNTDHSKPPSNSSHEKQPRAVVRPVPLGKVWSFDLVALSHNAIRMEMRDLDDIVWGLLDGVRPVNLQELRGLFAWFSTFEAFVVTCLKAEEEVLFPWVEQWGRIEGDLSTASRITTKGTIIRGIRDTAACAALVDLDRQLPEGMVLTNPHRHYYDSLKVGLAEVKPCISDQKSNVAMLTTVLERVAQFVASFSSILLAYFHEQECSLPVIIDSLYDEEDMHTAAIERRMIRATWKCGRKDESMIILMRAVEVTPFYKQWTQRNLRRIERFTMPLWKHRYGVGRGAVTAKFRQRNMLCERGPPPIDIIPTQFPPEEPRPTTSPANSSSSNLSPNNYSSNSRSPESNSIPACNAFDGSASASTSCQVKT